MFELLNKVKVISARGEYEGKFPGNVEQWKVHAFLNTEKALTPEAITNIIALGDSQVEMSAAHHLASYSLFYKIGASPMLLLTQ